MKTAYNNNSNNNETKFFKTHNNNNNIDIDKYSRSKRVETIADQLVAKFNNPSFKDFYCKIAWKLPEATIWKNYEIAVATAIKNGGHPGRLFTYLCKRDGV